MFALQTSSSKSQIFTVVSAEPEARYSLWKGLIESDMTASVWLVSEVDSL